MKSLQDDASKRPRLIVDAMLGKLARKLRLYGFDTIFESTFNDDQLLKLADVQRRLLITSDEELAERAWRQQIPVHLVSESDEAKALAHLFRAIRVERDLIPEEARCPKCNATIARVGREQVTESVPPNVLHMHDRFYRCRSCGKVYWYGSHWRRLTVLNDEIQRLIGTDHR